MQRILALALLVATVSGHAILTSPRSRAGSLLAQVAPAGQGNSVSNVVKLLTYADRAAHLASECKGKAGENRDQGPQAIQGTFAPGQTITLIYDNTLPHPDPTNEIRVRLKYSAQDGFAQNEIFSSTNNQLVAVPGRNTMSVTLPQGKTCTSCVLQWSWFSQLDGPAGGGYISCTDIAITAVASPTQAPAAPTAPAPTSQTQQDTSAPCGAAGDNFCGNINRKCEKRNGGEFCTTFLTNTSPPTPVPENGEPVCNQFGINYCVDRQLICLVLPVGNQNKMFCQKQLEGLSVISAQDQVPDSGFDLNSAQGLQLSSFHSALLILSAVYLIF